jgi:hypothetical protein
MTAVPVLVVGGLERFVHCATTWIVPELLGAWKVTAWKGAVSAPSMVPSGHGPGGGVVFCQLHCAPLAPFVCNSAMLQVSAGDGHEEPQPLTVACKVAWPPAATVALGGATDTVTALALNWSPPLPQPEMTISKTSGTTDKKSRHEFITNPPGVSRLGARSLSRT